MYIWNDRHLSSSSQKVFFVILDLDLSIEKSPTTQLSQQMTLMEMSAISAEESLGLASDDIVKI